MSLLLSRATRITVQGFSKFSKYSQIFNPIPSQVRQMSIEKVTSPYVKYERGQLNTKSYALYLRNSATNEFVSPFHDVPLKQSDDVFNMVVEIPRWSNAKMEISKKDKFNPIVQDVKKDQLRFVNNVFPYRGYMWNYGAFPQTWEDPNSKDGLTGCDGDNDPLDVCEIGSVIHERGAVIGVKVLGAVGLIDEGESDWKIIAIDVNDPIASQLNDVTDVEKLMPGLLAATVDWFRIYKIPTGKPANNFAENGKVFDREFALKQIAHDNASWKNLISGGYDATPEKKKGIALANTSLETNKVDNETANTDISASTPAFNNTPAFIDTAPIDAIFYVDRSKL